MIRWLPVVLLAASACSDLGPGDGAESAASRAIISNPMTVAAANQRASAAAGNVAFVSLPPNSIPTAVAAEVRNRRGGDPLRVSLADGGFDPVAISAEVGDTVDVTAESGSGQVIEVISLVVPPRRRPTIVRILPTPNRRDVPLNVVIVGVFSEPIDPASVDAASFVLRSPSTTISATRVVTDEAGTTIALTPSQPLQPSTTYEISVTDAVRDREGDRLETATSSTFRTMSAGATTVSISFASCVAPSTPVHFWFQDGSASWAEVREGPLRDFTFSLQNSRAAIAYAVGGPWGVLEVVFATAEELSSLRVCTTEPLKGAVSTGTVTGYDLSEIAFVNLGSGQTQVLDAAPATFSLRGTRGATTLIALRHRYTPPADANSFSATIDPNRVVIDRAFVSGAVLGFGSPTSFAPATGTLRLTGSLPGDRPDLEVYFGNADGSAQVFTHPGVPLVGPIKGIPVDRQAPGELHKLRITISRSTGRNTYREAVAWRRDLTSGLTVALGPDDITGTFEDLASEPRIRFRCRAPVVPEYSRFVTCVRVFKGAPGAISLSATSGWRGQGQSEWVLTAPDLSAFPAAHWGITMAGDSRRVYMAGFEGPGRIDMSLSAFAPVAQDGRSWRSVVRYDVPP